MTSVRSELPLASSPVLFVFLETTRFLFSTPTEMDTPSSAAPGESGVHSGVGTSAPSCPGIDCRPCVLREPGCVQPTAGAQPVLTEGRHQGMNWGAPRMPSEFCHGVAGQRGGVFCHSCPFPAPSSFPLPLPPPCPHRRCPPSSFSTPSLPGHWAVGLVHSGRSEVTRPACLARGKVSPSTHPRSHPH